MPQEIEWHILLARLLFAAACAAAIGWERERANRPAGLRTNILVGLGAAVLAVLAIEIVGLPTFQDDSVSLDPSRILAAVVGGVGFLGAGAVIQSGGDVRGLTTAAGIWVSAAIGMAAGSGMWFLAAASTALAFLVLSSLRQVEVHIKDNRNDEHAKNEN